MWLALMLCRLYVSLVPSFRLFLIKTFLSLSNNQSFSCFHVILVILNWTHWLNVDIFVTSPKSVPFHINWLASFWVNNLTGFIELAWSLLNCASCAQSRLRLLPVIGTRVTRPRAFTLINRRLTRFFLDLCVVATVER